jgi:hypothetical protein
VSTVQNKKAIDAINKNGAVLVFPINNRKEPLSLWHCLYPRSEMRWEWDESGDNRVAGLWHLRGELSISREVIYAKWYQGRATFFSRETFTHLLAFQQAHLQRERLKATEGPAIMEVLEMDSPLSTRQIKEVAELKGKSFEGHYNRVMKELWWFGLIVAFGEVEDSSFPSLAVGATSTLFEDIWADAHKISPTEAQTWLKKKLGADNLFFKALHKPPKGLAAAQ